MPAISKQNTRSVKPTTEIQPRTHPMKVQKSRKTSPRSKALASRALQAKVLAAHENGALEREQQKEKCQVPWHFYFSPQQIDELDASAPSLRARLGPDGFPLEDDFEFWKICRITLGLPADHALGPKRQTAWHEFARGLRDDSTGRSAVDDDDDDKKEDERDPVGHLVPGAAAEPILQSTDPAQNVHGWLRKNNVTFENLACSFQKIPVEARASPPTQVFELPAKLAAAPLDSEMPDVDAEFLHRTPEEEDRSKKSPHQHGNSNLQYFYCRECFRARERCWEADLVGAAEKRRCFFCYRKGSRKNWKKTEWVWCVAGDHDTQEDSQTPPAQRIFCGRCYECSSGRPICHYMKIPVEDDAGGMKRKRDSDDVGERPSKRRRDDTYITPIGEDEIDSAVS